MVYSKELAKWKAYQFSDPFATNSFVVCNKIAKVFCRPDCDARPKTDLQSEIKFMDFSDDALQLGFVPCKYCDPVNPPGIDVKLLIQCVETINKQIGFLTPLLDENEEYNNDKIKVNILELKKTNEQQILNVIEHNDAQISQSQAARRQSMPNFDDKTKESINHVNLSKNDSDHYRLVDLACRHLASAAAINLFFPRKYTDEESSSSVSSPTTSGSGGKKKRRRGGVLGFKELAAKSKLSAWHFHRVFKSVTGLTPKTYGDKCNEYLEAFKDSKYINYTKFSQSMTPLSHNESPVDYDQETSSKPNQEPSAKRIKLSNSPISPTNNNDNNVNADAQINDVANLDNENLMGYIPDNFMFDYRANSAPDLNKYNYMPQLENPSASSQVMPTSSSSHNFSNDNSSNFNDVSSMENNLPSNESIDALLEQSSLTNNSQQSLSSLAGPMTPQTSLFTHYKPEDVDLLTAPQTNHQPINTNSSSQVPVQQGPQYTKPSFELSSPNMNLGASDGPMDFYAFMDLNPIDEGDNQDFNEFLTSF